MKNFLLIITQVLFLIANGQVKKLWFPKADFKDSATYETGIRKLASATIPQYSNAEKTAYFNDLFRIYFANQNYANTLSAIDSFVTLAVPDKAYQYVPYFHYRVHCNTMIALGKNSNLVYDSVYNREFNALYYSLPDDGKDQVNSIYEKANTEAEKNTFLELSKKYLTEGDSISINNAVNLIKQWNFWQVYQKTVPLAMKNISAYRAYELANRENKLLGLDEGAVMDPNTKTFITNVTLIDVEKQKLVPNATIGITGNYITSVSVDSKPASLKNATIIDGTGQYLVPGLTDAHIHFFQSGGLYTRPDGLDFRKYMPYEKEIEWNHLNMKDVLKRNIINGITSVIDVGATTNFLQLRDKFKNKSFAPAVYMTGPLLTTHEPDVFKHLDGDEPFSLVSNEEDGRKMVQQQLPFHPDFIKIWYILDRDLDKEVSAKKYQPIIKAIIDEAHKHNLKVAVHATERISAQLAVESGCDYLVHSVDDEIIPDAFVKLLKEKKIILCPTLSVYDNYGKTYGQQLDFSPYELKNANPVQIGSLYDLKHLPEQALVNNIKNGIRAGKSRYDRQDSICLINLKKLSDAGVRIAAGTDAGNIGTMHGTSLLPELLKMSKSGMSNWQILQSATINPAYILNKEKQIGSITAGKIADLVLLKANPIQNLQNLQQINIVINKGFVIKPDTLIKETALALVQRQLNAYNALNLEAFLEPYAEDVELYQFPDKLISKGKEAMKKGYAFFNQLPDLHCEIKERIIQGNMIIDKESITGMGSSKPVEATAIYYIEGNKIKKVYFIR